MSTEHIENRKRAIFPGNFQKKRMYETEDLKCITVQLLHFP